MPGICLSADEVRAAPAAVRSWLVQQLGLPMPDTTMSMVPWPHQLTEGSLGMDMPDPTGRCQSIHNLIAERAYELWENEGRPHGHEQLHWHRAESEIMSSLGPGVLAGEQSRSGQVGQERPPGHL